MLVTIEAVLCRYMKGVSFSNAGMLQHFLSYEVRSQQTTSVPQSIPISSVFGKAEATVGGETCAKDEEQCDQIERLLNVIG